MENTQELTAAACAAIHSDEQTRTSPTVRQSWSFKPLDPAEVLASIDPFAYHDKEACAANYGAIRSSLLAKGNKKKLPEDEFVEMCANGHASGYMYRGGATKAANWAACHALYLDFDDGFSRSEFNQRCQEVGIQPTFAYATLSDGIKGERFRAVFILNQPTTDPRIWRAAMWSLRHLFKEADKQCFDAARIFLGGKQLLQHDPGRRINIADLVDAALYFEKQRDPKNFSKRCQAFTDETSLATSKGHLLVVASTTSTMIPRDAVELIELPGEQICDTKGCGSSKSDLRIDGVSINKKEDQNFHGIVNASLLPQISGIANPVRYLVSSLILAEARDQILAGKRRPKKAAPPTSSRTASTPRAKLEKLKGNWLREFCQGCRLLDDFIEQRTRLTHNQRLGFAHNLGHIQGFERMFRTAMECDLYNDSSRYKWRHDLPAIRDRAVDNLPVTCAFMACPYIESCDRRGYQSCLAHLPRKRNEIRLVEPQPRGKSLEQSRKDLADAWNTAYGAEDTKVHLILVDTGVGKTHTLLNTPLTKTMVAAPTHQLKEQLVRDYTGSGHFVWPKLPSLPEAHERHLESFYATGVGNLQNILEDALEDLEDESKVQACRDYLQAMEAISGAPVVFCTHAKVFTTSNSAVETIVFDEDPIKSILKMTPVSAADVRRVADWLQGFSAPWAGSVSTQLRRLLEREGPYTYTNNRAGTGTVHRLLDHEEYPSLDTQVHELFLADAFRRGRSGNFLCARVRRPASNKKVIILSASANKLMYERIFGDRLRVYDLRGTELKGRIHFHPEASYSKAYIDKQDDQELSRRISRDAVRFGYDGVIAYQRLVEKRDDGRYVKGTNVPVFTHFGAQYGLNDFQGRSIGIYGVPRMNDDVYIVTAKVLGLPTDAKRVNLKLQRHGFEFTSYAYANDELRELQLSIEDGEYAQCIGRARLVSNDCEVHVFSNHPVPHGELEIGE